MSEITYFKENEKVKVIMNNHIIDATITEVQDYVGISGCMIEYKLNGNNTFGWIGMTQIAKKY